MEPISEELVEKTWQEVAGFSAVRAKKEMLRFGRNQPDLLTFLMESTEELDPEARDLGIYMFFVVYRMFQATGKKIKRIPSKELIKCHEDNENLMESLEGAHERFLDRTATVQVSRQPYVMKYVVDALMEEQEDSMVLTEDDKGFIFLLLKTVVDVLDKVT